MTAIGDVYDPEDELDDGIQRVFGGYKAHAAAMAFPMASNKDLDTLRQSMREQGFLPEHPVVMINGEILDGRHRLKVAAELGIEPVMVEWAGDDSGDSQEAWLYTYTTNLARRHMTDLQKIMLAAAFKEILEEEAERRSMANLKKGAKKPARPRASIEAIGKKPPNRQSKTAAKLADIAGVSRAQVERVTRVIRDAPDLVEPMRTGELSIHAAEKKAKERTQKKAPPRIDAQAAIEKAVNALVDRLVTAHPKHVPALAKALRAAAARIKR